MASGTAAAYMGCSATEVKGRLQCEDSADALILAAVTLHLDLARFRRVQNFPHRSLSA
jgi:hypothetical protein